MPIQTWAHAAYWYEKGGDPPVEPPVIVRRHRWKWWIGAWLIGVMFVQFLQESYRLTQTKG